MKRKKERRGAINMHFLIIIIILVVSFAIILFFYWQFYWKGTITKETCHQSVLMRSTFNLGQKIEIGRQTIPLRCKTQKICLYLGEKKCGFEDEEGVEYIKVKGKDDKETKENIKMELANAMLDAWTTMGEGRLQIFHRAKWWESKEEGEKEYFHRCVIFSKIGFTEDLRNKFNEIKDFDKYLNEKIPGKEISYWDKFAGVDHAEGSMEVFDMREYENLFGYLSKIETENKQMILFMELTENKAPIGINFLLDKLNEVLNKKERHFISGIFLRRDITAYTEEELERLGEVCGTFEEIV